MTPCVVMNSMRKIRLAFVLFGCSDSSNENQLWALNVVKSRFPNIATKVVMTDQRTSTIIITSSLGEGVRHLWNAWHIEQDFRKL